MRFMTMVKSAEQTGPPPMELIAAIAKLTGDAKRTGAMLELGGLLPSALGARIRLSGGNLVLTDGPFAETKEIIGGYAVYNVSSKSEALDFTRRFLELHKEHWPGWEGECEIREMFDGPGACQHSVPNS